MHVLMPDWHLQRLVFEDLDAYTVRGHHERLIQAVIQPREYRHARRFPLGNSLWHVVDDEPDVIDHRALGSAVAFLRVQHQVDVDTREHDDRVAPGHEQLATHRPEESFIGLDIL